MSHPIDKYLSEVDEFTKPYLATLKDIENTLAVLLEDVQEKMANYNGDDLDADKIVMNMIAMQLITTMNSAHVVLSSLDDITGN
jgi:hypothetical protein